ncbi:MAG: hypothetical protein C0483_22585 [Pirellula sp.]|nr:hypothetical protein [Pirellula sp.]
MIELPLVALSGILGSSHCVGMCGGFVVSIGAAAPAWRDNLRRQSAFGFGRIFTYASLGMAAAYGGNRLVKSTTFVDLQMVLAIATGLLLVVQGALAAGVVAWLRRTMRGAAAEAYGVSPANFAALRRTGSSAICLQRGLLRSLLQHPGAIGPMLAGVLTGFLPCGLVYTMLALAINSGNPVQGAILMACFGLGTLPMLAALGMGSSLVGPVARQRMLRCAAFCVMAVGAMSIARGITTWNARSQLPEAAGSCPLCSQ